MTDTRTLIRPEDLPVYREKKRILRALEKNQVVVVESPTGSGKTTQLPLILHEAGYSGGGIIGVTQPRRIATLSVCDYIAAQLNADAGGFVGYKMRFEDKTTPETRIKIMTDGILLQEMKADPFMSRYSTIIIDEAHERSLNIDFILGLLKKLIEQRPDLKVLISSATINAGVFSEYFNKCPVISIETETFPINVRYEPPQSENSEELMLQKITEIVARHVRKGIDGDILVFLPGEKVIKDCVKMLQQLPEKKKLLLIPLYGRLSKEEQERVFITTPEGGTKVVVATNIAETSITIDGITAVIDSGRAKLNFYSPRNYTSSLIEMPVSKASCNQRKGRAGRTRPGTCYRLYTKQDFTSRDMFTKEEIYRTDLSEVVLRMVELDIRDFNSFEFISPPRKDGLIAAVETLRLFGAINDENGLTETGRMMAAFPMLPRHSRMIVEAINRYPDVIEETVTAAAFLTSHTPYILPQGEEMAARAAHHTFRDSYGDFVSYLNLYDAYMDAENRETFCRKHYLDERIMAEIANIKTQLEEIIREMGVPISSGGTKPDYLCAVAGGLMQFVCSRSGRGVYRSLTAEQISIHPGSVMFRESPRYIVAGEIVKTSRMFARSVSPLRREWLKIISEDLYIELAADGSGGGDKSLQKGRDERSSDGSRVKLGGRWFNVKSSKNRKKVVELPWEELRPVLKKVSGHELDRCRKMRAKVIVGGGEFLSGVKLANALRICGLYDPQKNISDSMPRAFYTGDNKLDESSAAGFSRIACLYKKDNKKKYGLITLNTDGNGSYWYSLGGSFSVSVEESLASLEVLADELKDEKLGRELSAVYRRLDGLL